MALQSDILLKRSSVQIWMLTTHPSENWERRNNQGREILHGLNRMLSDHIQTVNRNLAVKNTTSQGLKESYNMLLENEFLSGCGRCLSKIVSCSCVKTIINSEI